MALFAQAQRQTLAFIVVGILVITALVFAPIPEFVNYRIIVGALINAAHGPLFAGLAWLAAWFVKPRGLTHHLVIWVALGLLGLFLEGAQSFGIRDSSWFDIQTNLLGATSGLAAWAILFDRTSKHSSEAMWGLGCIFMVSVLAILYPVGRSIDTWIKRNDQFPVLLNSSFAEVLKMVGSTTEPQDVSISLRENSLQVELRGGPIPGVAITDIAPNWLGFDHVVIDVENSSERHLNLAVLIGDFESNPDPIDRFLREATLDPGERRHLPFTLRDISSGPAKRHMPMDKISEIVLFRASGKADKFLLHAVWLEN